MQSKCHKHVTVSAYKLTQRKLWKLLFVLSGWLKGGGELLFPLLSHLQVYFQWMRCHCFLHHSSFLAVSWHGRPGTWASLRSTTASTSGWAFTMLASCASSAPPCLFWRGTSPTCSSASWPLWSSSAAPSRSVWSLFPRSVSVWVSTSVSVSFPKKSKDLMSVKSRAWLPLACVVVTGGSSSD